MILRGPDSFRTDGVAAHDGDLVPVVLKQNRCLSFLLCEPSAVNFNARLLVKIQRVKERLRSPVEVVVTRQFDHICPYSLQQGEVRRI